VADSNLILHCGGRTVEREELKQFILPEATKTWKPISHDRVLDTALQTLGEAGYQVGSTKLGVSHEGQRFFGTLDLVAPLAPGVALAVGLRNSADKSLPMGFCAGSRVFVCDNLAFRADLLVKRKHTANGQARFSADIAAAVESLASFRDAEAGRIAALQRRFLSDAEAESLMLRACIQRGIVAQSQLGSIFAEYHEPRHQEFQARTAWSLLNAFTEVLRNLQERNPNELARRTMRLQAMLTQPAVTETQLALAI
jgi:Domain of unknown function (DUF932)